MEAKTDFSIHVVIVSHDPGLWFDETLESIASQDHPLVEVTVVDTGSEADPTARTLRVLPEAEIHRLGSNPGFGPAVNQAILDARAIPDFYVFCHDDVSLAPNALRLLAEEAVRSNAGIVGPKYVDWDEPTRIRQVGLLVDKTGASVSSVDLGEYDQGQHDAVQEMFAVPGGCVLVRADLFHAIGGFDPEMAFCYEHVDLCWRARIAGARVLVAPSAVVRHRQRLAERLSPGQIDRLDQRHRVRSLLSVYGGWHLLRVVPQAVLVSATVATAALLTGHPREFRNIAASWTHNVVTIGSIRRQRQTVNRTRHVSDGHVRMSQSRGFSPMASFLTDRLSSGRDALLAKLSGARVAVIVAVVTAALVLLGARDLITGEIPAVGELARLGSSSDLAGDWWSAHRQVGLGQEGFAPSGMGVLTLLSWLFIGQTGLLRTALIVGMVPLGAWGVWRLMRPFGSLWIQGVALAVYLANPVPYNAVANGVWSGLLLYGAAPWLVRPLMDGSGLAPFGSAEGVTGLGAQRRSFWRGALTLGVVFGLVGAMAPDAVVVLVLLLAGLLLGSALAGSTEGMVRMLVVAVVGAAIAAVLNLPWLAESLPTLLGDRPGASGVNSWAEILRFDTGPFGNERLGWALPAAAILPLALAHDLRLAWAVRGWALYLGTSAVALAAEHDWSPVPLPRPEVLQVPGAMGLAVAVAMGVAAFQVDVRQYRFGWRQLVPLSAVVALVAGLLPMVATVSTGDWNATGDDYTEVTPFADGEAVVGDGGSHNVLWLGHPNVLPLGSWKLEGGLWFAISDGQEFPTVAQRWVGDLDERTAQVGQAVLDAQSVGTKRLGAELAQWDVGTILVAQRLAPAPYGELSTPIPEWLFDMLDGQLDLVPGGVMTGIPTYHNTAWAPSDGDAEVVSGSDVTTSGLTRFLLAMQIVLWAAALVGLARLTIGGGRRRSSRVVGER